MPTPHYHIWYRSGRVFTLSPRRYSDRSNAAKVAREKQPDPDRRMVRACTDCPVSARSKRRPPASPSRLTHNQRSRLAKRLAVELGIANPGKVRVALDAALDRKPAGS